jgi:hypothetical protein
MRTFVFLLLTVWVTCGCAVRGEDRLVGVWTPDQNASVLPPIPVPGIEKRAKQAMQAFVLKLRSDNTFVIASGVAVEGRWSLVGDTLTLTPSKGQMTGPLGNALTSMTGKLKPDYSRITLEQPTPVGPVLLVLKKSA